MVSDETEWSYFGARNEANKPLVVKSIAVYFPDTILNVAVGRKDSVQVNKNEIAVALENILGFKNFLIWDMQFKRVIEFNNIGVMRQGYL